MQCGMIPHCMTAIYLLRNANVTDSQPMSVLSSASPADSSLSPRSNVDAFLMNLSYESIGNHIRQCAKPIHSSHISAIPALSALQTGTSTFPPGFSPSHVPLRISLASSGCAQHDGQVIRYVAS